MQTVLSWKALPGISNWIVQATDADGSTEHNVSEPRYLVIDPMDSVISYTVCPVAADGKRGIVSDTVEDYFSYARHLHVQGQYVQAVEALRSAKGSILDPKIDLEIVKNYVCQAQVHEDAENHTLALDYLRQAASIRGTSTEIALKAVHIYKISKDYLRGIKYLEGVNYEEDQSLISEYITLQYLNEAFATVIDKANLYVQKYGSDVIVLRYLATAHEEMEEFSHALSGFQRLASIEPSFENDLKIGELQIKTGRLKAAELHLQQMLTRYSHEKLDLVYFLLGECGMLSENYGIAIDHYLSAIRLDNSIAKYHYGLGAAYMQNNKPGESLNSFKKAYELSPTNAHYSFAYGRALKRQGDIESALSVLESAQDYVARNATAVEHHLLYANLLSSMSRYEDALREISVARSYQPDDPEIENRYLTAKAALQTQNLTREVIEFRSVQLNRIFPSLNKYYETNPIGQITLYNTSNTTITDLEISVFIHEVSSRMNTILVPTLIAKQEEVVPIPASFNDRLFDRPRIVPVDINLKFVHEGTQHNPSLRNQTVEILSNKAMDWQKRRSIASFVNPQDNNLSYFVKQNIVQTFRNEQSTILNRNLILALQAYSFYRANGVTFSSDSSISNLDTSQLDEVQFPFQLLETKAGDCEDLLVLMAGTLESIGTQTALIDIPGHVMLAVKVDMSAAEITKNGLNPDYFIERHATHWLPLETTLIGKDDFVTSWLTAIRHYKQKVESGLMPEIIEFADAQKLYPPSSFTKAINNKAYQNISDAKSLYQKDLAKILKMTEINQEMDFRAALERYPQNVSVKFQYAIWCVKMNYFDKAERLLLEIQTQDPRHFNAILNLGNIYAKTSRYELARKQYLFALEKTTTQKDQVYRNLCLLEYRDMNRAKAMEYFLLLSDKDIIKQVDMQIYADLMEQGE